ncbi:hypothetical protein [Oceanirhabdus seepicola]|uniref:Uncharacterized protein n=1 Tax=Oceanirhabdus seepicola TaxID=2828781 RepID=A0A9J6P4U3_9CLOT|nr:hypothetical protein [Oceanirhabdus seepicola]MCM1991158.1 hypothetical protein [Oceanirhabdus seepicola]
MDSFYKIFDILKKISKLENDKITLIKNIDSTINNYRIEMLEILSKSYIEYDFYHSYKHYLNLSKDPNYFNVYYKVNSSYMPIVTDVCLARHPIFEDNYDDYIKIATGTLSNLTLYCDSSNIETFPKEDSLYLNIKNKNELIDFDK